MAVNGFHTAKQIINESLLVLGETDKSKFLEAGMYFTRGYRDFQLFSAGGEVKEAYRSLTVVNTVNYPEDALRVLQVGVMVDREFFPFTEKDTIVSPTDPLDSMFNTDRGEEKSLNISPVSGYGAKGNNLEYYYKDERTKRRLVLSRQAIDIARYANRSEVIFRYVSNGISDFDNTIIASDAANMLTSYIVWQMVEARPKDYAMNYILLKKENFREEQNKYDTLELPDLQQLVDMIYETSSQNVRRV